MLTPECPQCTEPLDLEDAEEGATVHWYCATCLRFGLASPASVDADAVPVTVRIAT